MTRKILAASALILLPLLVYTGAAAQEMDAETTAGKPSLQRAAAQEIDPGSDSALPGQPFVADELLVRFRPGVAAGHADRLLAQRGAFRIRRIEALDIHVLRLPPGLPVERAVEIYTRLPEVEFAEPNYFLRILPLTAPEADPGLANQWSPQHIGAPQAWLTTEGDPSVVIAVVDTGVDRRHSELSPNMWTNDEVPGNGLDDDNNGFVDDYYGWDFVNNDGDPLDDHFHGTHVAGIAAAAPNDNSAGLVGICPRCRIMAVKVLGADGSGTLDGVANGITYAADSGARVVNLSLAGSFGSATLEAAVNHAWNQGAVVVAGAGNNGKDERLYPAAYANAMAIAASDSSDFHTCFSNFGAGYISVAAPGLGIYSTTLVDANGQDTYGTFSGTSMATPHAAGLAGLLFSQDLSRSNALVRSLMESTAQDLGPTGVDPHFGYGRISAARAVAGDTSPVTPPAGLFSDDLSASGYAHARKLARDANGALHLVWHGKDSGQYRVLYATSNDGGVSWSSPQVIFASSAETFHPALAVGGGDVYVAFPSKDGSANYQVFFTRRSLSGGDWSAPVPLLGGAYHAVRPDLYVDPATGKLHLVASSFDNASYVYYASSDDGGATWDAVRQVNVAYNSRYASVHANGTKIYIGGRTVELTFFGLIPRYRVFTIRSVDGGNSWNGLTEHALHDGLFSGEYGVSLAGVGDRLYLGYEHNGGIYFRRSDDGADWNVAENLGAAAWPSIAQGNDGQAWLMWESSGSLFLRHYTGSAWDPAETVLVAGGLSKGYYPNLKRGASGGRVEWAATNCHGAPYRLMVDSRTLAGSVPSLQFSAPNTNVSESAGAAVVTVTLTVSATQAVTVTYATADGTATAGPSGDYTATSGTLTFNPGETSQTFSVPIAEDTTGESDETITLTLSNPANAVLGTPSVATITIVDNDSPPGVAFSSSSASANENAGSVAVTVFLSAAYGQAVTVDYSTANGTATAGPSGDYTATSGTLTFNPGETSQTISVPIAGDTTDEPDETFTLALNNPTNAVLGTPSTATATIVDDDPAPDVAFSSGSVSANENAGSAAVTVVLSAVSGRTVTVAYATGGGTATAGSDYTATNGSLTFNPGETSKTLSISISEDALDEADETILLTLSNPTNAVLGTPSTATVTIVDNDSPPGIIFSSSSLNANENAGSVVVTVRLSVASGQNVTVNYATSNGTATAGSDYTAASGTLTFNPGETAKSFGVPIADDTQAEGNETIALSLSNPTNAVLGSPASATLTINANDTLTFSGSTYSVNENIGAAVITVRLNSPASQVVTVNYATGGGTATAGSDYTAASGTLTFNPGETSKTFSIAITNDTLDEPNETVTLTLINQTNAELGAPATATLTIVDND